jgi:hypothetical protein
MHNARGGRRAELQSGERRVESTPPTRLDSRALSSHTFNNESPCRPINNLCLSVANQPSQKQRRPAGRVVVIFECVRVHCDALCVSSVCTERALSLSVIYGRHNNKYIRRRRRACEHH